MGRSVVSVPNLPARTEPAYERLALGQTRRWLKPRESKLDDPGPLADGRTTHVKSHRSETPTLRCSIGLLDLVITFGLLSCLERAAHCLNGLVPSVGTRFKRRFSRARGRCPRQGWAWRGFGRLFATRGKEAQDRKPNGSRLSCGRPARRRKAVGRQFVPARAQHSASLKAITARQLQALVRQHAAYDCDGVPPPAW